MSGKSRRLRRILKGTPGRCLMVPLDHGPWLGPLKGIDCPRAIVERVLAGGANALLVTPGVVRTVQPVVGTEVAIVLRVSISLGLAPEARQETPVATVETALRLDADAVAVSIFFGRGHEVATMRFLGELTEQANRFGMPVLAEMMPSMDEAYDPEAVAHAARIGYEMGADIVKTNYCGSVDSFGHVVESSPVPIVVAGGPKKGDGSDDPIQMVREILEAGAAGVAIGRRVWQSGDPETTVREMHQVMFGDQ